MSIVQARKILQHLIWESMIQSYLHCLLEGISLVQQIADHLLCDRKLGWQLGASLDSIWITAIQKLRSVESIILPLIGSWWNVADEGDECLENEFSNFSLKSVVTLL